MRPPPPPPHPPTPGPSSPPRSTPHRYSLFPGASMLSIQPVNGESPGETARMCCPMNLSYLQESYEPCFIQYKKLNYSGRTA